jgi:hypothetical protein
MADILNKKRKDRTPQTIKVNIHSVKSKSLEEISNVLKVMVDKIKERHL